MLRREPQLVYFTSLTQMAVGGFLIWGIGSMFSKGSDIFAGKDYNLILLSIILFSLILGLIAAVLHLGRFSNVIHIFRNLSFSWLSREALWGWMFGSSIIGLLFVYQMGWQLRIIKVLLVIIGSLSGIVLVFVISRLYMLRTVPAWNNLGTPGTFFTTSILLGWTLNTAFRVVYFHSHPYSVNDAWVIQQLDRPGVGIAALVVVQFVIQFLTVVYLNSLGGKALESIQLLWHEMRGKMVSRWALAFLGVGLLIWSNGEMSGETGPNGVYIFVSCVLLLASEIIGRSIFYGQYRREGF